MLGVGRGDLDGKLHGMETKEDSEWVLTLCQSLPCSLGWWMIGSGHRAYVASSYACATSKSLNVAIP